MPTGATALKAYFNTGDKPTETHFGELIDGNLNLNDGGTVAGATTFTLAPTLTAGVIKNKLTTQSGTAAEDLSAVATDLVWVASTVQAASITLPQATVANQGMVIKILAGATWGTGGIKLGFLDSGDTVMFGTLDVSALNAQDPIESFPITDDAKALTIDADDLTGAGGAKGSRYTFTYCGADLVHVHARGIITTGTVAPDAGAYVATGI